MTAPTTGTALDTSELRALLSHVETPLDVRGRDFQVCTNGGGQWADTFGSITDAALIAAAVNNLEALLDAADRLAAVKAAIAGLHWNDGGYCVSCIDAYESPHEWPCPTGAALATDTTTEDS